MDNSMRAELIKTGWDIHRVVEEATFYHPGVCGADGVNAEWLENSVYCWPIWRFTLLQTH